MKRLCFLVFAMLASACFAQSGDISGNTGCTKVRWEKATESKTLVSANTCDTIPTAQNPEAIRVGFFDVSQSWQLQCAGTSNAAAHADEIYFDKTYPFGVRDSTTGEHPFTAVCANVPIYRVDSPEHPLDPIYNGYRFLDCNIWVESPATGNGTQITATVAEHDGFISTVDKFGNRACFVTKGILQRKDVNCFIVGCQAASGGGHTGPCDGGDGANGFNPGLEAPPVDDNSTDCSSPIIVDVKREGFHLTSAKDGVMFDIDGDGHPSQMAWTAAGSSNAFLALDLNGNGTIDSGKELFGNFTTQDRSRHPNGFLALKEWDERDQGGNGDGIIDARDAVWPKLRLWIDANHNGVSEPNELHPLDEFGIDSLSVSYQYSHRVDEFGNAFRYRGRVNPGHRSETVGRWAYDVFFVTKKAN